MVSASGPPIRCRPDPAKRIALAWPVEDRIRHKYRFVHMNLRAKCRAESQEFRVVNLIHPRRMDSACVVETGRSAGPPYARTHWREVRLVNATRMT